MKKKLLAIVATIAALSFGLGALSENIIAQLRYEFTARAMDNRVLRDVVVGISPSGGQFFQGKADANDVAAGLNNYNEPYLVEYLMGFAEGLDQSALLLARSQATTQLQDK